MHPYIHISVATPVVVVAVFTLKTFRISIQYLLFLTLQGKETDFRNHNLSTNIPSRAMSL